MNDPRTSAIDVVIPAYNAAAHLDRVLDRIAPQALAVGGRVIVVDDGSTDQTAALLARRPAPWLTVVHQENQGRARARNAGLQRGDAAVVVFLDSDILVDSEAWLAAHLEAQRRQPGVYMGMIRQARGAASADDRAEGAKTLDQSDDDLVGLCSTFRRWAQSDRVSWVCVTGANVSMPRQVVEQIGGFDPTFRGWGPEDLELSYRLNAAGLATFCLPGADCLHLAPRQELHYQRDRLFKYLRYFDGKHRSPEVRAYVRYVTGALSAQELFAVTTGKPTPPGADYFRPAEYFGRREGREGRDVTERRELE